MQQSAQNAIENSGILVKIYKPEERIQQSKKIIGESLKCLGGNVLLPETELTQSAVSQVEEAISQAIGKGYQGPIFLQVNLDIANQLSLNGRIRKAHIDAAEVDENLIISGIRFRANGNWSSTTLIVTAESDAPSIAVLDENKSVIS